MATDSARPSRQSYPAGRMGWQQWKNDHDAWSVANKGGQTSADMRQSNDPTVPRGGQPVTATVQPIKPPDMARMQSSAPFKPNTDDMTRGTPGLGMGKNTSAAKPAPATAAPAGIVADATPTPQGKPSWWNPKDDYTPDGGPQWEGTTYEHVGDLEVDRPEWWGEVKNFAPEHQTAMKRAYAAGDEAAFQQIRDRARADLYGGGSAPQPVPGAQAADRSPAPSRQSNDPHMDPIRSMPTWMDQLPDNVRLDAQNDWTKLLTRK